MMMMINVSVSMRGLRGPAFCENSTAGSTLRFEHTEVLFTHSVSDRGCSREIEWIVAIHEFLPYIYGRTL